MLMLLKTTQHYKANFHRQEMKQELIENGKI